MWPVIAGGLLVILGSILHQARELDEGFQTTTPNYDPNVQYKLGDTVLVNAVLHILTNTTDATKNLYPNTIRTNVPAGAYWIAVYNNNTRYTVGNIVSSANATFMLVRAPAAGYVLPVDKLTTPLTVRNDGTLWTRVPLPTTLPPNPPEYNKAAEYPESTILTLNGIVYMSTKAVPRSTPPPNSAYWMKYADHLKALEAIRVAEVTARQMQVAAEAAAKEEAAAAAQAAADAQAAAEKAAADAAAEKLRLQAVAQAEADAKVKAAAEAAAQRAAEEAAAKAAAEAKALADAQAAIKAAEEAAAKAAREAKERADAAALEAANIAASAAAAARLPEPPYTVAKLYRLNHPGSITSYQNDVGGVFQTEIVVKLFNGPHTPENNEASIVNPVKNGMNISWNEGGQLRSGKVLANRIDYSNNDSEITNCIYIRLDTFVNNNIQLFYAVDVAARLAAEAAAAKAAADAKAAAEAEAARIKAAAEEAERVRLAAEKKARDDEAARKEAARIKAEQDEAARQEAARQQAAAAREKIIAGTTPLYLLMAGDHNGDERYSYDDGKTLALTLTPQRNRFSPEDGDFQAKIEAKVTVGSMVRWFTNDNAVREAKIRAIGGADGRMRSNPGNLVGQVLYITFDRGVDIVDTYYVQSAPPIPDDRVLPGFPVYLMTAGDHNGEDVTSENDGRTVVVTLKKNPGRYAREFDDNVFKKMVTDNIRVGSVVKWVSEGIIKKATIRSIYGGDGGADSKYGGLNKQVLYIDFDKPPNLVPTYYVQRPGQGFQNMDRIAPASIIQGFQSNGNPYNSSPANAQALQFRLGQNAINRQVQNNWLM
jgi:pyruvate/2-oxoglutarate dehydrogenase complex dihydrolipoamide acyltransferase (E2) component